MYWLIVPSKRQQIWYAQYVDLTRLLKKKGVELKAKQPKTLQPEGVHRSVMIRLDHLLRSARRLRGIEKEACLVRDLRNLRRRLLSQHANPLRVRQRSKPVRPKSLRATLRGKQRAT